MAEIFANFEVNTTPRWRKLLKLTVGSVVLHATVLAALIYVPVLRDIFHIMSDVSVAEYVDEDYVKTQIRGVVMVDVSKGFQYPPGYFELGKPTQVPEVIDQPTPAPPENITPVPTPEPTPVPTPEPTTSPQPTADPAVAMGDLPQSEEEREKKLNEIAAQNDIERPPRINSKPFKDAIAKWKKKKDAGELDVSGSIEIVVTADRKPDGSLHNIEPKVLKGDRKLIEVVLDFVSALSDSHALVFLRDTNRLVLTVKANESLVTASVASEAESEARALELARGYNGIVFFASLSDKDESVYYKSTSVTSKGKEVIINFSMSRATASALLAKQAPAS